MSEVGTVLSNTQKFCVNFAEVADFLCQHARDSENAIRHLFHATRRIEVNVLNERLVLNLKLH
jgi:hypothetical protein